MRSLIDYYASLRSQRAFLLLIALISLGVTAFRASDRWEARSLLAVVDTTPMLLGLMVVVVVSGVWSAGSLNYYLLRYPSGNQVFAKVVLAAVIYAEAAAIAVFALSATEAFLISLVLGESFSAMTLIQALLRLLLLVGLFAFFAAGIGFCGKSVAASTMLYVLLVWLMPVLLVSFSLLKDGLGDLLSQYSLAFLTIKIQAAASVSLLSATAIFALWALAALALGAIRFQKER